MAYYQEPEIAQWYKDIETGDIFEVVAVDDDEETVDIQYFSGEIEELDYEDWLSLDLQPIPEPEDFTGPFELTREDLDYLENTLHPENWSGALAGLEPEDLY